MMYIFPSMHSGPFDRNPYTAYTSATLSTRYLNYQGLSTSLGASPRYTSPKAFEETYLMNSLSFALIKGRHMDWYCRLITLTFIKTCKCGVALFAVAISTIAE